MKITFQNMLKIINKVISHYNWDKLRIFDQIEIYSIQTRFERDRNILLAIISLKPFINKLKELS